MVLNAMPRKKNTPTKAKSKKSRAKSAKTNIGKPSLSDHDVDVLSDEQAIKILMSAFSGPLPPPHILKQYDECLPDTADRIITMAEKEQEFRHNRKRQEERHERLKIFLSFFVVVAYIFAAVASILHDQPLLGGIILISGAGTALIRYYSRSK